MDGGTIANLNDMMIMMMIWLDLQELLRSMHIEQFSLIFRLILQTIIRHGTDNVHRNRQFCLASIHYDQPLASVNYSINTLTLSDTRFPPFVIHQLKDFLSTFPR